MANLVGEGGVDLQDFLARAEMLEAAGHIVLLTDYAEHHDLVAGIGRLTSGEVALVLCAAQDSVGSLVEAERPTAREPDGTSFARVFEERWASDRACLVGFHARGRASWMLATKTAGEHALWLRYASRVGGRIAVGRGSIDVAELAEVVIPGTGAYEGKHAWAWTRVWRGALDAGEHTFTVRGGPLRLDASRPITKIVVLDHDGVNLGVALENVHAVIARADGDGSCVGHDGRRRGDRRAGGVLPDELPARGIDRVQSSIVTSEHHHAVVHRGR